MAWKKLPQYLVPLSAPLLLELIAIPHSLTIAQAQTKTPTQTLSDYRLAGVTFEPPPGEPAPTMTIGGGRRNDGQCPQERKNQGQSSVKSADQLLTLLLPSNKLGFTIVERPTFMVYVPKTSAKAAEFTLEDGDGKPIYQATQDLTGTPSVIAFSVPINQPALEIGKDYKWVVSMVCQPRGPEDPFAEGLVRRIKPNSALTSQLDKAAPLERVNLYAKNGAWYEALTSLAKLRNSQPNDPKLVSAWGELLQSAGLDAIATAPVK